MTLDNRRHHRLIFLFRNSIKREIFWKLCKTCWLKVTFSEGGRTLDSKLISNHTDRTGTNYIMRPGCCA